MSETRDYQPVYSPLRQLGTERGGFAVAPSLEAADAQVLDTKYHRRNFIGGFGLLLEQDIDGEINIGSVSLPVKAVHAGAAEAALQSSYDDIILPLQHYQLVEPLHDLHAKSTREAYQGAWDAGRRLLGGLALYNTDSTVKAELFYSQALPSTINQMSRNFMTEYHSTRNITCEQADTFAALKYGKRDQIMHLMLLKSLAVELPDSEAAISYLTPFEPSVALHLVSSAEVIERQEVALAA